MAPVNSTMTGARSMRLRLGMSLLALMGLAGCDTNLDLTNPNAPTEQAALANLDGVIATSLGMQDQLAGSILTFVRAPALVTDEWGTTTRALAADRSLFTGEAIDPSYGVVSEPYAGAYRVARTANVLLEAVPTTSGISPAIAAGLTASARLFKAMALGYAAMHYERLPLDAAFDGGVPVPRAAVFAEVISLLEAARAGLAPYSDAELGVFTTRAVSAGFSMRNTIDAMLARYYLITGQHAQADAAAARVNLATVSVLAYPGTELNPIHNYSVLANYVAPLKSWVDQAEPGDRRTSFWVQTSATPVTGNPPVQLQPFNMYRNRNDPFPVYLPGEMLLIRAEVAARANNLPAAIAFIDQVRAKTTTTNNPGAQLGPLPATIDTQAEVLTQIAYERRYELFSQGLRWEDMRRLDAYIAEDPVVAFLPLPSRECTSNPNAGC